MLYGFQIECSRCCICIIRIHILITKDFNEIITRVTCHEYDRCPCSRGTIRIVNRNQILDYIRISFIVHRFPVPIYQFTTRIPQLDRWLFQRNRIHGPSINLTLFKCVLIPIPISVDLNFAGNFISQIRYHRVCCSRRHICTWQGPVRGRPAGARQPMTVNTNVTPGNRNHIFSGTDGVPLPPVRWSI